MAANQRTKLVVRHLPSLLPETVFWKSVAPWVDDAPAGSIICKCYVPGKIRQRSNKHNIASRAYIQFATVEQVVEFHRNFDEHAFKDSKGTLYNAKVEFAPYQKTSGPTEKVDARQGTIEDDSDYQKFLQQLAVKEEVNTETLAQKPEQPSTTPLIEFLRAQRHISQVADAQRKATENLTNLQRKNLEFMKLAQRQTRLDVNGIAVPQIIQRKVTPSAQVITPTHAKPSTPSKSPKSKGSKKKAKAVAAGPSATPSVPGTTAVVASNVVPAASTTATVTASVPTGCSPNRGRGRGRGRGYRGGAPGHIPQQPTTNIDLPASLNQQAPSPSPQISTPSAPSEHSTSAALQTSPSRDRRPVRTDADQAGARRRLGAALAGLSAGDRSRKGADAASGPVTRENSQS